MRLKRIWLPLPLSSACSLFLLFALPFVRGISPCATSAMPLKISPRRILMPGLNRHGFPLSWNNWLSPSIIWLKKLRMFLLARPISLQISRTKSEPLSPIWWRKRKLRWVRTARRKSLRMSCTPALKSTTGWQRWSAICFSLPRLTIISWSLTG